MAERRSKLHHKLVGLVDKAVRDYQLISSGDRILVAVSGGADSMSMLFLLAERVAVYGMNISLVPVYLDMGFTAAAAENVERMVAFFTRFANSYHVESTHFGPEANREGAGKNPCFLCSRLRRKRLFEIAEAQGCNKIALGHHKDDIIETFLINVLYGRELSTMVPRQEVFRGRFYLVRPLAYVWERDLKALAREQNFPIIAEGCPNEPLSKRAYVKKLLLQLERDHRGTKENIFKALGHVRTGYLLG
ncbi:MAG: tRNA 2-thiocytidine(32) synthetase TtcA [Calditrichaeota bacterium]|nr:tRNA 2-thiocytidine(32) synthetase TtcA [Calditrichota bacterium]